MLLKAALPGHREGGFFLCAKCWRIGVPPKADEDLVPIIYTTLGQGEPVKVWHRARAVQ